MMNISRQLKLMVGSFISNEVPDLCACRSIEQTRRVWQHVIGFPLMAIYSDNVRLLDPLVCFIDFQV